ncbi:putative monooxygenase [Basidiobolus meristosporus CBS 931.73]|uniref:Putative monooxygenase n=1 Tax=Basidiobolus meristosporus CBS 931.73 TaxID=1314790 RepID=A0A1Y1YDE2_9FUNG|nr:putative monooxygenase [Basidiobolus meristosporus CBS 931.73]|eukprot:ORX96012.1 putative monooxygenase [Basidiobolus meristosporus CBS 931.73]
MSTNANTSVVPRIGIVGGGLSGLILARVLLINGIPSKVFEYDDSWNSRPQGGTLDLHTESGQLAMRTAGLWEDFERHVRYEGQAMRILDKTGQVLLNEEVDPSEKGRPEVDRTVLRKSLIDSLGDGIIQWGAKVKSVHPLPLSTENSLNTYKIVLGNGKEEVFDIVVGADGAWSRVRSLLSDATPTYCGVTMMDTTLENVDTSYTKESKLVGDGTMFALGENKGIISQRNGDGSIRTYITLRIDPKEIPSTEDSPVLRSFLLERFADWSEDLKNFIRDGKDLVVRPINCLPIDHHWKYRPGLTIIGDAAHVMSPFAGEGANLAMLDGVELASAIVRSVKNGENLYDAVEAFEISMLERSSKAAQESADNLTNFISSNGAQSVVDFFKNMQPPADL